MRISLSFVTTLLLVLFLVGTLQARVFHTGAVNAVFPNQGTILINQQWYQMAADIRIYNQSDSERPLSPKDLSSGLKVVFDPVYSNTGGKPLLKVIVIQDRP